MPYQISWYVEQRVLRINIIGKIDIDEFERLHTESFSFVETSSNKVHAIVDLSQFEALPTNLRMLTSATSEEKSHNQGMTILVMPNMNGVLRFLCSVVMQTLRLEYRVCETNEQAVEILNRVDPNLRELSFIDTPLT